MLSVDQALEKILAEGTPLAPQRLALSEALGCRLAEPLVAQEDQPAFANSAMDGYAVLAPVEAGSTLAVVEEIPAGASPLQTLSVGLCSRIYTGAMVPAGATAVIAQEDVERLGQEIVCQQAVPVGQHIRQAGEHFRQGDVLAKAGDKLHAARLGLAALLGYAEVQCVPRPRVILLSSGDELVEPGVPLGPAQVRNSNIYALEAQVRECGAEPVRLPILPDDPNEIRRAIMSSVAGADLLICSGGASVGARDYVQQVLQDLGAAMEFWRVAMRPGKPLGFARLGATPILALPGNPVSCSVTFELFGRPLLDRLAGGPGEGLRRIPVTVAEPISKRRGLRTFVRVRRTPEGVRLAGSQESHMVRGLSESDGLLELGEDLSEARVGEEAQLLLWPWVLS